MQASLFANLSSLTLSPTLTGGAFSWPKIVAGSDLTISLRWAENIGGTNTEILRTLNALKVSLGKADARPTSGGYKLYLGSATAEAGVNVTAAIAYNATAPQLAAAINALTGVAELRDCTVSEESGTMRIVFADASAEIDIAVIDNTLRPVSFVEVNAVLANDTYVHELRLTQTPIAQTVDFALVASEPPVFTEVRAGGADGDVTWNEVQKLTIPPEFRGSFEIRRGYRKTAPIGLPTSGQDIADAIAALADDDSELIVTEVQDGVLVEFTGDMGGVNQALLTVGIVDQPVADPTFTLRTDTAETWTLMGLADSRTGEIKVPIEIKAWLEDEEEDEADKLYIFKQELTLTLPVDVQDRNAASEIQWNQPRGRRAVIPFTPGHVQIGNRSYSVSIGDESETQFTINHNLNAAALQISVRENATDGRLLTAPTDFNISFDDDNALTITPQPDTNGVLGNDVWLVTITMADESVYEAHGHVIEEVTGLRDELDALGAAITDLQALVPTGALSSRDVALGATIFESILAPISESYPGRVSMDLTPYESLSTVPPGSLPRDGGLLPAAHDATATDIESAVLPDLDPNEVYVNATEEDIVVPGAGGRRGITLRPGQAIAADEARWYRVSQEDAAETSWYPTDFERELFVIAVNDKQLIAKRTAEIRIGFEVALMSRRQADRGRYLWDTTKNTVAQWEVVIEHGAFTSEASPSTTGKNIKAITWSTTPILAETIQLTSTTSLHSFGVRIVRDSAGEITSEQIRYGASAAGGSAPASANFALRARLRRFDILDGIADPKGVILFRGLNRSVVADDTDIGKLIIR